MTTLYETNQCIFFQAEDGIRDGHVTGVQTCALPIFLVSPILTEGNAPSTSCVEIIFVWCLTLTKMIKMATTTNNKEKIRYFIQLDISSQNLTTGSPLF